MSWEDWKNQIKTDSSSHICADSCGIFDIQGNAWAKEGAKCDQDIYEDPIFGQDIEDLKGVEILNAAIFSTFESLVANGIGNNTSVSIGGESYMILRAETDEKVISGKRGQGGFTAAKCNTCYVIGFYSDSTITPGNNKNQVVQTQANLKNAGF